MHFWSLFYTIPYLKKTLFDVKRMVHYFRKTTFLVFVQEETNLTKKFLEFEQNSFLSEVSLVYSNLIGSIGADKFKRFSNIF